MDFCHHLIRFTNSPSYGNRYQRFCVVVLESGQNDIKEALESLGTLELIRIFQQEKSSDSRPEMAFVVLCSRFRKNLLKKCEIICSNYGHSVTVAEIIAGRTFSKYAKSRKFDLTKSTSKNPDLAFELYLLKIARRELINYYREEKRKENGQYYDGTEKVIKELPPINFDKADLETKITYKAIMSLSESHRTVYLTYKYYERMGCNLPGKLLAELREALGGVKQSTVRFYKKEAQDKIDTYKEVMMITKSELDGTLKNG